MGSKENKKWKSDFLRKKRVKMNFLSQAQKEIIHKSSLRLLEKVGVNVFLPEAVDLLKKAGAEVIDNKRVKIPSDIIEAALETAPKNIEIYNRDGDLAMQLKDYNSYYGTGPTIQYVYDVYSGKRRPTGKKDIENASLICDYLPNIDFVLTMGMTGGIDPKSKGINPMLTDRYDFEAMLTNTIKPLIFSCWSVDGLSDIYDMAIAVCGNEEIFFRKPFIIYFGEPVSPLQHDKDALECLMFSAQKGIPTIYSSYPLMGATGPVTSAGVLALSNAEFLSGLAISQLVRKGAPVIYSSGGGPMDMRTSTTPYNAPEALIGEVASKEMALFYGLPNFSYGGVTDSKMFDQQAGYEAALSLFQSTVMGSNLIHDVGYMETGLTASWELIVMVNEAIEQVKKFAYGFEVNDETLAIDLIEKVGPGGNFLTEDHTLKHFKEVWYPKLMNRDIYENWSAAGSKTLAEVCNEKAKWILENHKPKPLKKEVKMKIDEILERSKHNIRDSK